MSDVQLTIGKEIVNPIVEAKIKEAILSALGGGEQLIAKVVDQILKQKVNEKGSVSSYSHDNKFTWLDVVLTNQINEIARDAIKEEISKNSQVIKEALVKNLQSKKGANLVANALLDAMNGSFTQSWRSSIKIELNKNKED